MKSIKSTVILSLSVILLSVSLPFLINKLSEKIHLDTLKCKVSELKTHCISMGKEDKTNGNTMDLQYEPIVKPFFLPPGHNEIQWVFENSEEIPPSSVKNPTQLPLPDSEILSKIPYPENIEDNDGAIMTMQYGYYNTSAYFDLKNAGQVRNCTSIPNKTLAEISQIPPDIQIELNSEEPQVLIYHSHATESYEPYTRDFYDKDFSCKTTDITKNMIAVGEEIVNELNNAGIHTLHDRTIHDYPSYNNAYNSSRNSVSEILEKYPSIKVVLDIHRDGIERDDGTRIAPVCEVNGERVAQIMIISCCDDGGNIPLYKENFKLASLLQSQLETDYSGITRPILFDYRFYNQDLSTGSLLIEIGSHGNSLSEAKLSGKLVGKSLSQALKNLCQPVD
ncbi:MAG: stage II sporulation protein P [Oscillospiraceae bacterium]|nr:stage II sporulation protein P [Oscillospiraceae bacterium]MBQ8378570.1 stage II sporulation protein P [Oscillospiraceae bacterium]